MALALQRTLAVIRRPGREGPAHDAMVELSDIELLGGRTGALRLRLRLLRRPSLQIAGFPVGLMETSLSLGYVG